MASCVWTWVWVPTMALTREAKQCRNSCFSEVDSPWKSTNIALGKVPEESIYSMQSYWLLSSSSKKAGPIIETTPIFLPLASNAPYPRPLE